MQSLFRCTLLVLFLGQLSVAAAVEQVDPATEAKHMLALVIGSGAEREQTLMYLQEHWRPEFTAMALEALYLSQDGATSTLLLKLMQEKTGQQHGLDINAWYEWLWNQPAQDHPYYADFKAQLYALIDPKFGGYFDRERQQVIRLDEVRWGGVRQDGIPPLRNPKMIPASQADYLDDDNIVFGVAVNGDVRAYPKRILAWHEMFVDTVGGVPVAGVYCTLCGTVILYETTHQGVNHQLGTSGFLYRSNKLMYDQATQSLWNTMWGRPSIGPLVGQDITLERLYLVTTTWGEWRRRHPNTQVLSLDTGHRRDYGEGVAYQEYFATDDLMFGVPKLDRRLKNKDEVLALTFPRESIQPLAIATDYLLKHRVYHASIGALQFVVLTDSSGANRVYETKGLKFSRWDGDRGVTDGQGVNWILSEDQLSANDGRVLKRLPAHRAFWFGWYSAYPETRLIH